MSTIGFECVHCHHRLSVSTDWAGKAVRCPKCQTVNLAPSSDRPIPTPPVPAVIQSPAPEVKQPLSSGLETDSIFSDTTDDESVIGGLAAQVPRPLLPSPKSEAEQPTVRGTNLPETKLPIRPPAEVRGSIDLFAGSATVSSSQAEVTNPFRKMVDEVLSEAEAEEASSAGSETESQLEVDLPTRSPTWQKWALIGVSCYALLATIAAVWGWTRTPADKPVQNSSRR